MNKSSRMSIVHSHAAGVDIGAEFHVVAIPPDADAEPVRTFQSLTGDPDPKSCAIQKQNAGMIYTP